MQQSSGVGSHWSGFRIRLNSTITLNQTERERCRGEMEKLKTKSGEFTMTERSAGILELIFFFTIPVYVGLLGHRLHTNSGMSMQHYKGKGGGKKDYL